VYAAAFGGAGAVSDQRGPERALVSDPFISAYQRLKAYVAEGHTQEDVTEFAQQLNRELPQDNDIATAMIKIRAIGTIVHDLNGVSDE
jgi:hypothetical protein